VGQAIASEGAARNAIELVGICKRFGGTEVVRGVDLACPHGELVVLVGPSGCGKSTLLRLIAGLEEADAGEIRMDGRRVNELPPRARDVAMVFQSYALYPHMTVRQNLGFALAVAHYDKAEIERAVTEVARLLELGELLDRKPAQLSGGQRQRVAMGRAMVRKPKLFLFDEPLSNLDAALRTQMRLEIKRLHQRLETSMVYVTHDQVEAMTLADRICVLQGGRVKQVGTPKEIYERPQSTFVAGFIGTPPINLLPDPAKRDRLVGIRPHAFRPAREGDAFATTVTVEVIEPLGWEANVHVRAGESRAIAQMALREAAALAPGTSHRFGAQAADLHFFDKGSGKRLEGATS
jgi:ABC-type sugar transport system ATPase subunit